MEGGGGCEAEGGFFHVLKQKSNHYVLMKVQKGTQCTFQAEKVVGNSFTPSAALLVHPSNTVHSTVDFHGFTRSQT